MLRNEVSRVFSWVTNHTSARQMLHCVVHDKIIIGLQKMIYCFLVRNIVVMILAFYYSIL